MIKAAVKTSKGVMGSFCRSLAIMCMRSQPACIKASPLASRSALLRSQISSVVMEEIRINPSLQR